MTDDAVKKSLAPVPVPHLDGLLTILPHVPICGALASSTVTDTVTGAEEAVGGVVAGLGGGGATARWATVP